MIMKIQSLAVIFIIIILPISMILSSYTRNQVKTLSLQTLYDSKLDNATYDALKAFQLNTLNSDTSDLSNSKLRDVEASANSFFNSIASNFNMAGYNQDILMDYVPALVYTMYDGYYIYSPYDNTLDKTKNNEVIINNYTGETELKSDAEILNSGNVNATYKEGQRLSGVKPYIHYSCRYKKGVNIDVVITYSLDNYITIEGTIGTDRVYKSGYLLDNIIDNVNSNSITYRNIPIDQRLPTENINQNDSYEYIKLNGAKYYIDNINNEYFSFINGKKFSQGPINPLNPQNGFSPAVEYYKDAKLFTDYVRDKLGTLESTDAVDEKGNSIVNGVGGVGSYLIFAKDNNNKSIEDPDSNFNQQRLEVIRYSIEKNLSTAIANYNSISGVTAEFRMPKLKDDEWDKIINNVSIISFLQGLSIGGKIYNGYSIITNNKNQEVVKEDSIYIVTSDGQYHKANEQNLETQNITGAAFNLDFERRLVPENTGESEYFYPKQEIASYASIVSQTNVDVRDNFYEYMANKGGTLAQIYFTTLGRERYGMYKTNNDPKVLKDKFGIQ